MSARLFPWLLGSSLFVGLSTLLFHIFKWRLLNQLYYFAYVPLLGLYLLLLILFVGAAFYAGFRFREERWIALLPLGAQLLALALSLGLPWTRWAVARDFNQYHAQRMEVVELARENKLQRAFRTDHFNLPVAYEKLSINRTIRMQRQGEVYEVFFYARIGMGSDVAGFIYRSDDQKYPIPGDMNAAMVSDYHTINDYIADLFELQPHWFYFEGLL